MKSTFLIGIIGILFLSFFYPLSTNGQINSQYAMTDKAKLSSLNLNPFQDQAKPDFFRRGYGKEFVAAELSLLGGTMIAGGVFVIGFLFAWSDSGATIPLIIGSGLIALATPAMAGYFLHLAGRKNHPEGKLGSAILGTYLGTLLSFGAGALLSSADNRGGLIGFSPLGITILPALTGVLFYNIMPRMSDISSGKALLNSNKGNFSPGLPALSVTPNPFSPRTYFTQFSLLSMSF